MLEILATKIVEKAIDGATSMLGDVVRRRNNELLEARNRSTAKAATPPTPTRMSASLTSTIQMLSGALQRHVEDIRQWCYQIRFEDLRDTKSVQQVYVELDTYLLPVSLHEAEVERTQTAPLLETLKQCNAHCLLLGTAGAGKTTSIQKICVDFFQTGKVLSRFSTPVLIRLRDLPQDDTRNPLISTISADLALHVHVVSEPAIVDLPFTRTVQNAALAAFLDGLNALLLVDGFDELPTEELRDRVLHDITYLTNHLRNSKLLITSRSADFRYKLSTVRKFELAPLTEAQVESFAKRWLKSNALADDFLAKVYSSPFADTTIRPLSIAHLCAIYERIQDIPEKPKSVYKRIVRLLLEDWDAQRTVRRFSHVSKYARFDNDRKFDFLANLAFVLTTELKQLRFSSDSLREAYAKICNDHELPADQSLLVTSELESHSGLIVQSGFDHFEFAHKSLQEYLAADYIVRLPDLELTKLVFSLVPNELAIATALSSRPSYFLVELFLKCLDLEKEVPSWISTYLSRLVSEKPELHVGASGFSAVAVMSILSRINMQPSAFRMLQGAFPRGTEALIREHYVVSFRKSDFTFFTRTNTRSKYNLPYTIRVPTTFLQLLDGN